MQPPPQNPLWYYTQAGQRLGPSPLETLLALQSTGQLLPTDLAWRDGMPDWLPVSEIPELTAALPPAPLTPASLPTAPPAQPATTLPPTDPTFPNYYHAPGQLPAWAAATLAGHAQPRGDVTSRPLDDATTTAIIETLRLRKKINSASAIFKVCAVFLATGALFGAVGVTINSDGNPKAPAEIFGMAFAFGFVSLLALFCVVAARATRRSHQWPLVVILILFGFGILLSLVVIIFALATQMKDGPAAVIVYLLLILLLGVSSAFTIRALLAIPKYLQQPAWCQELLARSKI